MDIKVALLAVVSYLVLCWIVPSCFGAEFWGWVIINHAAMVIGGLIGWVLGKII